MGRAKRKGESETNGSGDEVGMFAVGGVPIAPIEDANDIVAHGGKGLEELDESMFIVDLLFGIARLVSRPIGKGLGEMGCKGRQTLSSGLDDILAVARRVDQKCAARGDIVRSWRKGRSLGMQETTPGLPGDAPQLKSGRRDASGRVTANCAKSAP